MIANPRPADTGTTPPRCTPGELRAGLTRLAGLYERSTERLTRTRPRPVERTSGRRFAGIALDEQAVAVRDRIRAQLAVWVAELPRALPRPARDDVTARVGLLVGRADALAARPDAALLAARIDELVTDAEELLDPDARRRIDLGRCPTPGCGARLLASFGAGARVGCAAGHEWAAHEWLGLRAGLAARAPGVAAARAAATGAATEAAA